MPATPIPMKAGENLAIYFERQGLVPYTLVDEADPQLWEFWQPNNSGKPLGWRHARALGPARDRCPAQAQLLRRGMDDRLHIPRQTADQGRRLQVFRRRGVIPVKLKPSCGDRTLAPTIKITYTGQAAAGPNETVSSVGPCQQGRDHALGRSALHLQPRGQGQGSRQDTVSASTSRASKLPPSYSRCRAAPSVPLVTAGGPASPAGIAVPGSCERPSHPGANLREGPCASPSHAGVRNLTCETLASGPDAASQLGAARRPGCGDHRDRRPMMR